MKTHYTHSQPKTLLVIFLVIFCFFWLTTKVLATASVTTLATGGEAISADTAGGTYTTLTGPVLTENTPGDIGLGTIILNTPSGFAFRTTANSVTATITDTGSRCKGSSRLKINNSSSQTVTPTVSSITINVTQKSSGSCMGIITWSGIAVRPINGTPLASGNITKSGTSVISGITGLTNFGTLTEVAGAKTHVSFTIQPSTSVLINTDIAVKPVIAIKDQFENTVTSDNSTLVSLSAKQSSQTCAGTNGLGILTTTPSASGATVSAGMLTYTTLQYSYAESIKICAISTGITSGLSNAITVYNPLPATTSISPISATSSDPGFTLIIDGTNFVASSIIKWGGSDKITTYVSPTRLTAYISTEDIETVGNVSVTVYNPTPGGGTSNAQTFTINPAPNPLPSTTNISPTYATAGGPAFTLTVDGTGFIASSTVKWGSSNKTTTYVSPTSLTAQISTEDIASSSTVSITVYNPAPGGGTSNAQTFQVIGTVTPNPVPVISSISPSTKTVGDTDFTMSIFGSNFIASSTVHLNGIGRNTIFSSSTELFADFFASDLLTATTSYITVINPAPGGGASNAETFTVLATTTSNPVPTLTFLSPNSKTEGSLGFTMSIFGTGFIASSTAYVDNIARTTTYFSPTKLLIDFLTSELLSVITYTINVITPAPGGGTSNSLTFYVLPSSTSTPTLTNLNPSSVIVGSPDTVLVVTGTNFTASSTILFDNVEQTTTFISSTELSTLIPASFLATYNPGILVTVFAPEPSGGTSNSLIFIIDNQPPTPQLVAAAPGGTGETTIVLFTGKAFPGASISIIDNDAESNSQTSQEIQAETNGSFRLAFVGISEALHSFTVLVKDNKGRLAHTKFFSVNTSLKMKNSIELQIPPTVEIKPPSVRRGDEITITGYAASHNFVQIEIDNVKYSEVQAGEDGSYQLTVSSGALEFGKHNVRASQSPPLSPTGTSLVSDFSVTHSFTVSTAPLPSADFNDDGIVDVQDLGIFLSKWVSTIEEERESVDINNDSKTNLTDFSILIRAINKK
ncbi:MAG: dockerin type I domain-containing protein [Candidatus Paceibacterota bacterium]